MKFPEISLLHWIEGLERFTGDAEDEKNWGVDPESYADAFQNQE